MTTDKPFTSYSYRDYPLCRLLQEDSKSDEQGLACTDFIRSILDSLAAHIAVLDETGTIVAVNRTWREFAASNPPIRTNVVEGANYLAVCELARGDGAEEAAAFAAAIRAMLVGEGDEFALEYPCHSPDEERWFLGRVTRLRSEHGTYVVVAHENITGRKQIEQVAQERQHFIQQVTKTIPDLLYVYDLGEQRNVYANREAGEALGYTREEIEAMRIPVLAFLAHPEDRVGVVAHQMQRCVVAADGDILQMVVRLKQAGGHGAGLIFGRRCLRERWMVRRSRCWGWRGILRSRRCIRRRLCIWLLRIR